ncbi:MAG: YkvA family protein [Chthoniobacterales bacterium]
MRKAKTKTRSPKRKPPVKIKKDRTHILKERLEAEFAEAVKSAKSYVQDPQRLRALFQEAAKEAASLPRDPFKETWPYFQTMLRLIRTYYQGDYRDVDESMLVVIIAAIIYVVNPLDLIPDAIPALGFLDDATVLALAVRRARQTLDDFMTWETTAPDHRH